MLSPIERAGYLSQQAARVAWYMGHYFASGRFRTVEKPRKAADPRTRSPGLGFAAVLKSLADLFAHDFENVERGLYPMPRDNEGTLATLVDRSRRYFADLPASSERKAEGRGREVHSEELAERLPAYFLQNFHYQTGGYLTEESARLYDTQVEVLFSGGANAMRRQCLVPIAEHLRGRDQRGMTLLDAACGTGRFLRSVAEAFPRLSLHGLDLSQAYLDEAGVHLAPHRAAFHAAAAEAMPFPAARFDVVTTVFLFHEVPPPVRRAIAREFARVLKPGGLLVFMDSLQTGDAPQFDGLLERFPDNFHEPFYGSYLREDLKNIFGDAGLRFVSSKPAFLSKLAVFERTAPGH